MYIDPGATATDNVDGNITSRLTTYGVGAVKTVAPTATASPYVITYNVIDSSGNQATPGLRYVVVTCKSPTVMCTASDGTLFCSTTFGVCIESTTVAASTSGTGPTIRLIGQAVLGVTEGTSYLACPTPQPTNVICDRQGTPSLTSAPSATRRSDSPMHLWRFASCDVGLDSRILFAAYCNPLFSLM